MTGIASILIYCVCIAAARADRIRQRKVSRGVMNTEKTMGLLLNER